jgi:hypothetical protein
VLSATASALSLFQTVDFFATFPSPFADIFVSLQIQSGLLVFLSIVGQVLFFVWLYRAIRNLPVLGAESTDLSPGFVIFSFYLPVLNWFLPFLAMRKLWRASFNPKHWPTQSVGLVVTVLWGSWVLGHRTWVGSRLFDYSSIQIGEFEPTFMRLVVLPESFRFIALLATVVFINAVWRAQEAARSLSAL